MLYARCEVAERELYRKDVEITKVVCGQSQNVKVA